MSSLSLAASIIADDGWCTAEPEAERRASFSRVNDATVAAAEDPGGERGMEGRREGVVQPASQPQGQVRNRCDIHRS